MVEANDVAFGFVAVILLVGIVAATGVALPGSLELFDGVAGSGDADQGCTLRTEIGVEGTLTNAKINPSTYRQELSPTEGFAFNIGTAQSLALTGAEDIVLKFTLNGPIDSSITDRVDIGELGKFDAETVSFVADRLPAGEYVLHHNLFWGDGSDYYKRNIVIPEGC